MGASVLYRKSVMNGQRVGYVRVSTFEQNVVRQLEGIELDRTFTEKASGKDTKRQQLDVIGIYDFPSRASNNHLGCPILTVLTGHH
jgi:DNA invertase Pin-like site-specific DNA recombinase